MGHRERTPDPRRPDPLRPGGRRPPRTAHAAGGSAGRPRGAAGRGSDRVTGLLTNSAQVHSHMRRWSPSPPGSQPWLGLEEHLRQGVLRRRDLREGGPAVTDGEEQLNVFVGARRVQTPANTVSKGRASGPVQCGRPSAWLSSGASWTRAVPEQDPAGMGELLPARRVQGRLQRSRPLHVGTDHALATTQAPWTHRAGNAGTPKALLRPWSLDVRSPRGEVHRRGHRAGHPLPLPRNADPHPVDTPASDSRRQRLAQRPRHVESPVR